MIRLNSAFAVLLALSCAATAQTPGASPGLMPQPPGTTSPDEGPEDGSPEVEEPEDGAPQDEAPAAPDEALVPADEVLPTQDEREGPPPVPRAPPRRADSPATTAPAATAAEADGRAAALDPGGGEDCEAALGAIVTFEREPAIREGACGAPRPLTVEAAGGVTFSAPPTLRCPAATALGRWVREVVEPASTLHLKADVDAVLIGTSYACRARRSGGRGSDRLSEHAFANAVDVSGVRIADGRVVPIEPRLGSDAPERAFQAAIRGGACAYFRTVIGPTTNALHADHLHLDVAPRSGGYRLCQ